LSPMIFSHNTVVIDLAFDVVPTWAVVYQGQLLPMRFKSNAEASGHLAGLTMPAPVEGDDADD